MAGSLPSVCCSWVSVSITIIIVNCFHLHRKEAGCEAAPVVPDLWNCHLPVDIPSAEAPLQCCPPGLSSSTPTPRLFQPTAAAAPASLRLRRSAHQATPAYAEKLARAYDLMRALPADDPRSFAHQANIHCAYCNSAYNHLNTSQLLQVHGCWLFAPFHRWYIFFHERILARLLGDDEDFALTFWNYDHPNGSNIPWLFHSSDETLVSVFRDPLHNRPNNPTVSIDCAFGSDDRTREQQLQVNDFAMNRALVRDAATQDGFFGFALRQGDDPRPGSGSLERLPHNNVHMWVGNKSSPGFKDMGSLFAAARDPVFYSHHAQLDRLWEVWKTLPDHQDITDPDFLDSEFIFYNEDAELVRVRVGDSLNATLLGYAYEDIEIPWMDAFPDRCSSGIADLSPGFNVCAKGEPVLVPCSVLVERPDEDNGDVSEVLLWAGTLDWLQLTLQADSSRPGSRIDTYVNLPEANSSTSPGCMELLGTFESHIPGSGSGAEEYTSRTEQFGLYGRLMELDLTTQSSVVITLVPFFPTNTSLTSTPAPLIFESCSIFNQAATIYSA